MPIIGNPIYQSAFVTDQFSGNGSTTAFTMSVAPAGVTNVLVAVSGVLQDPSTYGVVGNTITFSAAPPSGTGNISCRYLGVPVTGVTTTAYRTVTEFTATASQTTFTPPSYSVGFINVYLNGVLLGSADYTATNGTTVVLAVGASAGNLLTVESFLISSVANAIANAAGSVGNTNIATGAVTPDKLSTGGPSWNSTGTLTVTNSAGSTIVANRTSNPGSIELQHSGTQTAQLSAVSGGGLEFYQGSSPTLAMKYDSAGRVTTPFQPAFLAYATGGGANTTTGNYPYYLTTSINVGSSFSTSTGRFTAPIAGTYIVFVHANSGNGTAGTPTRIQILKNGTALPNSNTQIRAANTDITFDLTQIVSLAVGDYVNIYAISGQGTMTDDSAYNFFGGYLLG